MSGLARHSWVGALLALLIALAAPRAALSGCDRLVLCFGRDGHVELEVAHEGRCGPHAPGADHADEPREAASENHCGNCTDLVLPGACPSREPRGVARVFTAAGPAPAFAAGSGALAAAGWPCLARPAAPPPPFRRATSSLRI